MMMRMMMMLMSVDPTSCLFTTVLFRSRASNALLRDRISVQTQKMLACCSLCYDAKSSVHCLERVGVPLL